MIRGTNVGSYVFFFCGHKVDWKDLAFCSGGGEGYLWISGLFLGFIISASAAFLWYMAKRSLRLMSEEGKC